MTAHKVMYRGVTLGTGHSPRSTMTRLPSALGLTSTLLGSAFVIALGACRDSSTSPTDVAVLAAPSANVLTLGDLRRAVPGTPCNAAPYRQFDFWLGEWSVATDGVFDGTNDVTSELDGCLVAEHWGDAGEVKGWS